ncbi:MAG: 16S rRNA (cytidine(1402)-2'-O)-methyltransferase [Candidatus Pacebacteria bacterium]|nr:16S rRNA (cytidine(1402)-2'-O)-methyltransferase [Candidatus Paceibacterota bacterium]
MGILYVIGTPIGNLKDISLRSLEALKEVDLILCEDTRETKKLLEKYEIKKPLLSYHQHSKLSRIEEIAQYLREGKNLALVSDAGTPGISDPGNLLIEKLVEIDPEQKIFPIPGPSALTSAASVSGFPVDRFLFLGFPPQKKKRKKFFEDLAQVKYSVILYESPWRIIKTLENLRETVGNRKVVVCRELTKKFETTYRGGIKEVAEKIKKDGGKGEFVIILNCEK